MDQKAIAFARHWARLYVRTKHPHGLDEGDVENRILESLYKYGRGKFLGGADPNADPVVRRALAEALNAVQDEGRRNLRALFPWQIRCAEPGWFVAIAMLGSRRSNRVERDCKMNVRRTSWGFYVWLTFG